MTELKTRWYHLAAILTVIIWGTTFISTKVLINNGLSPVEILLYRFILAYICILFISPKRLFAKNIRDELLCAGTGLCGGSLYFVLENTALQITLASNVSLIICTAPIFTAFLSRIIYRNERIKSHLLVGSLIALLGVSLVVFNGSFILKINPLGDILTILAAVCWAFYGIILQRLNKHYPILFITRKVFFYGIITLLPVLFFNPTLVHFSLIKEPVIFSNLIFLGIIASLFCYITWNTATKKLGVVQTAGYIYLIPLVTVISSAIIIKEPITIIAVIGCIFILCGVYTAERGFKLRIH
jgi:Permeases of the drug/metabolite transporter (DMT) superfamily